MTDNTQPEAMRLANVCSNLTRYSMDAHLIAAELRRQHARIAELEAEIAGGVQALSAAPGVTSEQRRLIGVIADKIEDGTLFQSGIYPKKDLARFVRNMLDTTPTAPAASPTPPAEQQAQPGAVYAELPQPDSWFHFTAQFWENKLRDFADRTHALRMQAAPKAAPCSHRIADARNTAVESGYLCVDCGAVFAAADHAAAPKAAPVTQQAGYAEVIECGNSYAKVKLKGEAFGSTKAGDIFYTAPQPSPAAQAAPASVLHLVQDAFAEVAMAYPKAFALHKVGLADTAVRKALVAYTPQAADSVQEDAALWHWLAEYLVGTRTDLDDEIVASETVNDLRKLVKAAIKQGEKQ